MTKKLLFATIFIIVFSVYGCADRDVGEPIDASTVDWQFFNERAEEFIILMNEGNFSDAVAMFDRTMTRALKEPALKKIWDDIIESTGNFVSFHKIENQVIDGYFICEVTSFHTDIGVTLRVVFDKDGLIAGYFNLGYSMIYIEDDSREIIQREGFADYPVIVAEGTSYPLPGIMSIPDSASETNKVPGVVIVHGSGPNDMDLTMGLNKPYRDIAEYLAANGIAVIRYDKRTLYFGIEQIWTVYEETIEDAILAANLLRSDPRIDENNIFIIGHSLGGMLAPRIHIEGGNFAGLILLAGSPRFLLDIIKDQNITYINETMEGEERDNTLLQIEEFWDTQVNELMNLSDDEAKKINMGNGETAYYYLDLYRNPISGFIEQTDVPFLVLQGANDVQILPDVDFVLYQKLLANRLNVTFILYEKLNHLFMPGPKLPLLDILNNAYEVEGHVYTQVLINITDWIHAHS